MFATRLAGALIKKLCSERGSILVLAALSSTAVIGIAAMVLEGAIIAEERRSLQNAVDAAALAGAVYLPGDTVAAVQAAEDYLEDNEVDLDDPGLVVTITTPYDGQSDQIAVDIEHTTDTVLAGVFGILQKEVVAHAAARYEMSSGGGDYAFMALSPTECRAFNKVGSSSITINDGGIMVNSDCSGDAVRVRGSGDITITGGSFDHYWEGGVDIAGSGDVDPLPTGVAGQLVDPIAASGIEPPDLNDTASYPIRSGTPTNPSTFSVSGSSPTTLYPGIYYGGIHLAGSGTRTLEPGVYIMAGGGFKSAGSGGIIGNGVLIYNRDAPLASGNKGDCDMIDLTGSSDLDVHPLSSGPWTNIGFWQDEDCDARFKYTGSHTTTSGVIYVPSGKFDVAGSGDLGPIQVIADTIDISGSSSMTIDFTGYVGGSGAGSLSLIE